MGIFIPGKMVFILKWCPGPQFNIKMTSYQYRKSHCGDKTILRPSYRHNGISYTGKQGWGQFRFFNSIPIPIPLFPIPIPIPIPLLTISFNSNSNSNSRHFNSNSNSNSGELKSNLNSWNDLLMSSSKFIMIMITRYMYTKLLLLIPSVSYPLLNGYNYMALVDPISIA